jgi:hypothetical protein
VPVRGSAARQNDSSATAHDCHVRIQPGFGSIVTS